MDAGTGDKKKGEEEAEERRHVWRGAEPSSSTTVSDSKPPSPTMQSLPAHQQHQHHPSQQQQQQQQHHHHQHHHQHHPHQYSYHPVTNGSQPSPHGLPSIQHIGSPAMQSQPQYAVAPMPAQNAPPPLQQHPPPLPAYDPNHHFAYQNGAMAHMPSTVAPNGMMRFPIAPQAPAHFMGTKPKSKEVKRRTKTGCLTCRKRRIKCDEGHPTCRNCQKSKRDCLGYDPIFKQQAPAPIQPAPDSSAPSSKPTPSPALPSAPHPSQHHHPHHQPPASFAHSSAAADRHPYPHPPPPHHPGALSHGADGSFEYGASLDPALAPPPPGDQAAVGSMATMHSSSSALQPVRTVKPVTMDQLFCINDIPPRYHERESPPPDAPAVQEIDDFYRFHYAQGLDKVFETRWYTTNGPTHIRQTPPLLDFLGQCVEQFRTDASATSSLQSLEARLVWHLATMPRQAYQMHLQHTPHQPLDQPLLDLLPRIDTLENLLTGHFLPAAHIPPPPSADYQQNAAFNEQNFWHHLGRFAAARDDTTDPAEARRLADGLAAMRSILGLMESRDILYSLAIARHVGGRWPAFEPLRPAGQKREYALAEQAGDLEDDVNKLRVAHHFVEAEDLKGTTQVIQRVCGMAMRGWALQQRG